MFVTSSAKSRGFSTKYCASTAKVVHRVQFYLILLLREILSMGFIKAQKIIRDENGVITSRSAAIVDTIYAGTGRRNNIKIDVREKLRRVIYLSDYYKSGISIFMFPTRGMVEYDALIDTFESVVRDDPRISTQEMFPMLRKPLHESGYLHLKYLAGVSHSCAAGKRMVQ